MTSKAQIALDQAINEIENKWGYEGIKEEMHEIMKPILKDLEILDYYEKIKLMLKQKESVLRYIESEDCFAVKAILDEYWYKLSKKFVENNIKEEIKPLPLIVKIEKQNKILEILKPYFKGAILDGDFHFRFTPEQEKIIKEWLENEK